MTAISKGAFKFLRDLGKNMHRDWFNENKATYTAHQSDLKAFAAELKDLLDRKDRIEKAKVYRIYRDVRFSKDKTPFKSNYSMGFNRAGKALRGGYYLHLEPGNSYLAGGFFSPNPADLLHIRKQIQGDPAPLRKILKSAAIKKGFGDLLGAQVKTAPKGFSKEDPAIDLLRYKQFYLKHEFSNAEVHDKNFSKLVAKEVQKLRPYFDYMSDILTSDLNGQSLL